MGIPEAVQYIREKFQNKYAENIASGLYDDRDIDRLQTDTTYARSFIRGKDRLDEGVDLVHSCFKYRKESNMNDVTEQSFERELWDLGGMYYQGRDNTGNRILWLRVHMHRKDAAPERLAMEKLGFAFALERAFKEQPLHQVVVCLDMTSCGIVNLDIDFVKFIITCFKSYYPTFLAYLLIYDMPWIFNAAWKVIKAWLSAEQSSKIKFVTKGDIQTYINADNLPLRMGGTDDFVYEYHPGVCNEPLYPEDGDSRSHKKVSFQDVQNSTSMSTECVTPTDINANATSGSSPVAHSKLSNHMDTNNSSDNKGEAAIEGFEGAGKLLISPPDALTFDIKTSEGEASDLITLNNTLGYPVAFKVKTTSPEKYRVRPSSGYVQPNSKMSINIYLLVDKSEVDSLSKDKFLIMAIDAKGKEDQDVNKLLKAAPKNSVFEYKLKCKILPDDKESERRDSRDKSRPSIDKQAKQKRPSSAGSESPNEVRRPSRAQKRPASADPKREIGEPKRGEPQRSAVEDSRRPTGDGGPEEIVSRPSETSWTNNAGTDEDPREERTLSTTGRPSNPGNKRASEVGRSRPSDAGRPRQSVSGGPPRSVPGSRRQSETGRVRPSEAARPSEARSRRSEIGSGSSPSNRQLPPGYQRSASTANRDLPPGYQRSASTANRDGSSGYQRDPSSNRTRSNADRGNEPDDDQVERLEQQNQYMQRQLNILLFLQIGTAVLFLLIIMSYSCFGEELFTRFLALPFSFCGDQYGRKC